MKAQYETPKAANISDAIKLMQISNIAIITGAVVSAESGVFVYKDNEETVDLCGNQLKIQELMNIDILESNPIEFWRYIQETKKRIKSCDPFSAHTALSKIVLNSNSNVSLITQNIDGFDKIELFNNPNFYEIHGNINEMRCTKHCTVYIIESPSLSCYLTNPPNCGYCASFMRPNVLLYGETYPEDFYRSNSPKSACLPQTC